MGEHAGTSSLASSDVAGFALWLAFGIKLETHTAAPIRKGVSRGSSFFGGVAFEAPSALKDLRDFFFIYKRFVHFDAFVKTLLSFFFSLESEISRFRLY